MRQFRFLFMLYLAFITTNVYAAPSDVIAKNTVGATVSFTNYDWYWDSYSNRLRPDSKSFGTSTITITITTPIDAYIYFESTKSVPISGKEKNYTLDGEELVASYRETTSSNALARIHAPIAAGVHTLVLTATDLTINNDISFRNLRITDYQIEKCGDCGANGNNVQYEMTTDGILKFAGTGAMKDYQNYYGVNTPWDAKEIKKVEISEGVTKIGVFSFCDCTNMTSVSIPTTITFIGTRAFQGCRGLTSVIIPGSVISIENSAFYYSGLTSITIPNSVVSIGESAFSSCSSLNSVVSEIQDPFTLSYNVFYGISSTCTLTVPYGTKDAYIAAGWTEDVFKGGIIEAPPVKNITFKDEKVKAICVANWDTNKDGELSEAEAAAVTDLGEVFKNNTQITSFDELQYFTGVKNISKASFWCCPSMTSVTIPNSVTSIGDYAFQDCSNLSSVTIPNSVTSIGKSAFYNCCRLTSGTIPCGVTSIGEFAFSGCLDLTSVTIPNSVMSIGKSAFSGCSRMTSVHITDLAAWCNISFEDNNSNPLYSANHLCVNGTEVKDLIIPNSVTSISQFAFVHCSGFTSVTIPNSVTSIGNDAFNLCVGLTSVTIPNSVTSIGESAFMSCSGLTSVTIPNSVTSLGKSAFMGCSGLTSVIIPNSVTSISYWAFYGCWGLTSVTIPNSVTSIKDCAFQSCSSLNSVTIPNSVVYIGDGTFYGCRNLTSVVSEIEEPFTFGANAFDNIASTCTLTVPYGTKDAYIAKGWKESVFKGGIVEAPDPRVSQSMTLASLPSMTYGDATYTLPSKTNEGLNLTWNSSATSVATISGNTLTVKGAGSATITATQAGNDDYKPFSKEFTLTVAKAPLTITAQSYTIKQGEAMPTFAATYTGFKNNETPAALTIRPTLTCSTTSSGTLGTYDITPSGASSANYKITYVKGTLTVLYNAAIDNTLAFENAEVSKGGRVVLPVKLNNTESITALQFEVALPVGAILSKCQLTDRKGDDHKASYRKLSNGNYQVTVLSMSKAVFSGTEGAVVNLTLDVDKGATAGAYPISITNIELTTAATQAINPVDVTAILTINNVKPGDTNGDGKVSITDAVMVVSYILGESIDNFVADAADVDGNGKITITDAVAIVDMILSGTASAKERVDVEEKVLDPQ